MLPLLTTFVITVVVVGTRATTAILQNQTSTLAPLDLTPATIAVPLNKTVAPHVCEDSIDNCRYYGRAPCTERVYEAWARAHCNKYCGFCVPGVVNPAECHDKLPNCHEFDDGTLCSADSFYAWAYEYCRGYCKFEHCSDVCRDQENVDCQAVDQALNLCADTQRAMRVCQKYCKLCHVVNGQWSQWTTWSECSVTCGNGTVTRQRLCNNPNPANGGMACQGSNSQNQQCTQPLCPVHGGWGSWSGWSDCSATCDVGLQNRQRQCDSPRPARNGDHCFGTNSDYKICSHGKCSAVFSAFTVKNPHAASIGSAMSFTTVVLNEGKDYNTTTGLFTCDIPGLYFFTLSLTKVRSSSDSINDSVGCYISKNRVNQVQAFIDPEDGQADVGSYGTTASVTLRLVRGDVVSVDSCSSSSHMESWSLFSGFLIAPDN